MSDRKLCIECVHCLPAEGHRFFGIQQPTAWEFARCTACIDEDETSSMVTGKLKQANLHFCSVARLSTRLCGGSAESFEQLPEPTTWFGSCSTKEATMSGYDRKIFEQAELLRGAEREIERLRAENAELRGHIEHDESTNLQIKQNYNEMVREDAKLKALLRKAVDVAYLVVGMDDTAMIAASDFIACAEAPLGKTVVDGG